MAVDAAIGSKITQALKAGSGVDINELATSLAEAESMAQISMTTKQKEETSVSISGYGVLKAAVTNLKSSFEALQNKDDLLTHSVASSSEGMIDAEITSLSSAKAGTTRIQVLFVARPEVTEVTSNNGSQFTSATATISGLDKVHLAVNGGTAVQVNVLTPTPKGIVDAINAANVGGITARTLIKESTGTKVSILVESKTGQANNFTITTNLSSELTRTQKQAAQDLKIKVNNLTEIYRDNNSPTDVVEGVQLKIKQTTGTVSHNIVVTASASSLETSLNSMVEAYNNFIKLSDYLTGESDEEDEVAGSLSKDKATVNMALTKARSLLSLTSATASNGFNNLRDIGITSKAGGEIGLQATTYAAALKSNFSDIRMMLTGDTNDQDVSSLSNKGLALNISIILDSVVSDTGPIKARETSVQKKVADYEEQLLSLQERFEGAKTRYLKQFAAMESLVQRNKNTGDYLTSQFEAMQNSNR